MTTFNTYTLRKFSRAQMNAMLVLLGIRIRGLTREEAKQKLIELAEAAANGTASVTENQMWTAYFAVRDGKAILPASETTEGGGGVGGLNIEEAAQKVAELAIASVDNHVSALMKTEVTEALAGVEEAVQKAINKARPIEVVVKSADGKTVGKKKPKGIVPTVYERVLQLAAQGINTLLVGPAGCGKTHLGSMVADGLNRRFSSISCSAGMSESQLAGWLLPTGAAGKFEYVPSPFIDMYENGGVFLLDEVDSSDPNTLTFINKALANAGFYVPQRFKSPCVQKHPHFTCIAAANTFGTGADAQYVGRNALDAATLDRFAVGTVYMDYDPAVEEALVEPAVLTWGRMIRDRIRAHKLRRIMSTRVMLDITVMVRSHKWDEEQWSKGYFAAWSVEEIRKVTTL